MGQYLSVVVLLGLAVAFGGLSFGASRLFAPHRRSAAKEAPYECGIVPLQEPVERFPVKFYLVAMLFVIFDVEIIFLFLWAVRWQEFGWAGAAAVILFMLMLIETLAYVWKRGALDWNVARRARYRRIVAPDATLEEAA